MHMPSLIQAVHGHVMYLTAERHTAEQKRRLAFCTEQHVDISSGGGFLVFVAAVIPVHHVCQWDDTAEMYECTYGTGSLPACDGPFAAASTSACLEAAWFRQKAARSVYSQCRLQGRVQAIPVACKNSYMCIELCIVRQFSGDSQV